MLSHVGAHSELWVLTQSSALWFGSRCTATASAHIRAEMSFRCDMWKRREVEMLSGSHHAWNASDGLQEDGPVEHLVFGEFSNVEAAHGVEAEPGCPS
jgi:hypothetical protein